MAAAGSKEIRILDGEVANLGPVSRAHVTAEEEVHGLTLACRVAPVTNIRIAVEGRMSKPSALPPFSRGAVSLP